MDPIHEGRMIDRYGVVHGFMVDRREVTAEI